MQAPLHFHSSLHPLQGQLSQCKPCLHTRVPSCRREFRRRQAVLPPLAAASEEEAVNLDYNSGDGKKKATIEHVFGPLQGKAAPQSVGTSPWEMGFQVNERNLVWNDGLKVALIKRVAAQELKLTDQEMDQRLDQLAVLLPGLVPRLLNAPPKLVAKAAANVQGVANRLLELKLAFPQADILSMVNNRLSLLCNDQHLSGRFQEIAQKLEKLLPKINVSMFVAEFPLVLDVDDFERAIDDVRMMGLDPVDMLRRNPSMVLAQVKGRHLIPYDQLENPFT